MIEFRIDRRAGVPTYLQIVQQVQQALLMGRLQVGDKLPTAREVVASTAINPNTVLKAYRELERDGLVQPRVGAGTFITRGLSRPTITPDSALGAELGIWVAGARRAGLARHEIEALLQVWLDQEFTTDQPAAPTKGAS